MADHPSRRWILGGLASGVATAALGAAPETSPRPPQRLGQPIRGGSAVYDLVKKAGLTGVVTYAALDVASGEVIDAHQPGRLMPPASTLKAVTAIYARARLGEDHRFETRALAIGPVVNGRLEGDLVLAGGGDPTLDTDRLAELAIALREAGLVEVTGRFLVWAGALPGGERIDDEQPEHVAYNPSFGGLNLNFNRVHFNWAPIQDGYDVSMEARALKNSPRTRIATMALVDREAPVFDYYKGIGADRWSVAQWALGKKEGARWLPVRLPALYAGDVFRTLCRSNGIVLKQPEITEETPGGEILARAESPPVADMVRSMLKYSTNLTAECLGLAASGAMGVPVDGLIASGSRMAGWCETQFGPDRLRFRDHSGLGYGSDIGAGAMAEILRKNPDVRDVMKRINVPQAGDKKGTAMSGVEASAKTGTLNFVSTLAGFSRAPSGQEIAFAIFTADKPRRDAIPVEQRESPPGARGWARRSRNLQKAMIARWMERL